jgi:hypothetical protein
MYSFIAVENEQLWGGFTIFSSFFGIYLGGGYVYGYGEEQGR